MSEAFCGFTQTSKEFSRTVLKIRPGPIPYGTFPVQDALIIQSTIRYSKSALGATDNFVE
jgi:hypothetical protein